MYAILDEQRNVPWPSQSPLRFSRSQEALTHIHKTCMERTETAGRRTSGYTVEPVDESISIPLPTLLECNQIHNVRTEILTPDVAHHYAHLKRIANKIPPLIVLLLGRDIDLG